MAAAMLTKASEPLSPLSCSQSQIIDGEFVCCTLSNRACSSRVFLSFLLFLSLSFLFSLLSFSCTCCGDDEGKCGCDRRCTFSLKDFDLSLPTFFSHLRSSHLLLFIIIIIFFLSFFLSFFFFFFFFFFFSFCHTPFFLLFDTPTHTLTGYFLILLSHPFH